MSEVVSFASGRRPSVPRIRIGLLRLTDGAPVIVAHEFGFFADEGVEAELFVEPSWANIADKLAFGFIDAAVILPPLAFAVQLGLRGAADPVFIPYTISTGGNSITLDRALAQQTKERAARKGLSLAEALASQLRERPMTLGVVHAFSTHNLLLRYWLATAGIVAGRDVKLAVVPPALAVEALTSKHISGFCAGAPWGEVAAASQSRNPGRNLARHLAERTGKSVRRSRPICRSECRRPQRGLARAAASREILRPPGECGLYRRRPVATPISRCRQSRDPCRVAWNDARSGLRILSWRGDVPVALPRIVVFGRDATMGLAGGGARLATAGRACLST